MYFKRIIFIAVFILYGCNKEEPKVLVIPEPIVKSDKKEIVTFKFLQSDNSNLVDDYTISVNESDLSLMGSLPFNTDLENLVPTIEISPNAKITPASKTPLNLEEEIEFIVTAEDGSTIKYELTISVDENQEAKIVFFKFLEIDNNDGSVFEQILEDINGEIDDKEYIIEMPIAVGTRIDALIPTIEISEFATISPESKLPQNFSQPITYTVTSQSGEVQEYTISLVEGLKSERQLLMEIDALNSNNTLNWDFSVEDISDFPMASVTVDNGNVTALNLNEKGVTFLPRGLNGFTQLNWLNLSGNNLEAIPDEIFEINTLKSLYLTDNLIATINSDIEKLTSLENLFLANNTIVDVPQELLTLSGLRKLHIDYNEISNLPRDLGNFISLEELILTGNNLNALPQSTSQLTRLRTLNLRENEFTDFPEVITSLQELSVLAMDDNYIVSIPTSIQNLQNLEAFLISSNTIDVLPDELGALTALRFLWLNDNQIVNFPNQYLFPNLEDLNLGSNEIEGFPTNILEMTSLEKLQLNGLDIQNVPIEINELENLKLLNLNNSNLSTLPKEIGDLMKLGNLNIANNSITSIPAEICDLEASNNLTILKDETAICE